MSEYFTCHQCGKNYKKGGLATFASGATMGISNLGKHFCSNGCEKAYERDNKKSDSNSSSSKSNFSNNEAEKVVVKPQKTAEQIIAEAEADRIERETDRIEKEEAAKKPWMHESNFQSKESINAIVFPDDVDDLEKTILKIISTVKDKIKEVTDGSVQDYELKSVTNINPLSMASSPFSMAGSKEMKALQKPFQIEMELLETAISKAKEGIRKLRRFDDPSLNHRINDCNDLMEELSELKPKLNEKINTAGKKKQITTYVILGIVAIIIIAILIAKA
jgi:hypothetical protein